MRDKSFGLPRDLGDGLVLRWATSADTAALVKFNTHIHEESEGAEEGIISGWVEDLVSGRHPTTSVDNFTVVVDTQADDKIVSSLCIIPQIWQYEEVAFPVGRPELVGTLAEYRKRRLVRAQMEAIHAKGAARNELMQGITGIPWYYRLFDYEMALDLGGGRRYLWQRDGNLVHLPNDKEPYTWRTARLEDIELLGQLYAIHCATSMINTVRTAEEWRYALKGQQDKSAQFRHFWVIQHKTLGDIGYVQFAVWGESIVVHEVAVVAGHSLRAVCLYLTRMFKGYANLRQKTEKKPITELYFRLGIDHPVYAALGRQLERQDQPYAWYIRIPDLPAFLRHITPVLERRLAASVMAGHSGELKLNFYARGKLKLVFDDGRLSEIGTFEAATVADGDARFPDLLFTQLICGRRTLAELNEVYVDCFGSPEAEILLGILFPKRPSNNLGLG